MLHYGKARRRIGQELRKNPQENRRKPIYPKTPSDPRSGLLQRAQMATLMVGIMVNSGEYWINTGLDADMQPDRGGRRSVRGPNPSWVMARFWLAVVVGAVIYGFEKSLEWLRRRMQGDANSKEG